MNFPHKQMSVTKYKIADKIKLQTSILQVIVEFFS